MSLAKLNRFSKLKYLESISKKASECFGYVPKTFAELIGNISSEQQTAIRHGQGVFNNTESVSSNFSNNSLSITLTVSDLAHLSGDWGDAVAGFITAYIESGTASLSVGETQANINNKVLSITIALTGDDANTVGTGLSISTDTGYPTMSISCDSAPTEPASEPATDPSEEESEREPEEESGEDSAESVEEDVPLTLPDSPPPPSYGDRVTTEFVNHVKIRRAINMLCTGVAPSYVHVHQLEHETHPRSDGDVLTSNEQMRYSMEFVMSYANESLSRNWRRTPWNSHVKLAERNISQSQERMEELNSIVEDANSVADAYNQRQEDRLLARYQRGELTLQEYRLRHEALQNRQSRLETDNNYIPELISSKVFFFMKEDFCSKDRNRERCETINAGLDSRATVNEAYGRTYTGGDDPGNLEGTRRPDIGADRGTGEREGIKIEEWPF